MATITSILPNFFAGAGYTPNISFNGTGFPTTPEDMKLTLRTTGGAIVEGVTGNFAIPNVGSETTKCRGTLYCDGYTPPGTYVLSLDSKTLGLIPGQPFTILTEPVVTTLTPTSGTGLGPHTLTVTGTNFFTTAYKTRLVLFIEPTVGGDIDIRAESDWLTATATSFTAPITFDPGTVDGRYQVVMEVSGYGYSHHLPTYTYGFVGPTFIKTTTLPTLQVTLAAVEYLVAAPAVEPGGPATYAVTDQALVEVLSKPRALAHVTQAVVETLHRPVTVPNIVGLDMAVALTTLENAGLRLDPNSVEEFSTYPDNMVLYQNPAAGTIVGLGAAVVVIVSKGPAPPMFAMKIAGVDRTTVVRATGSFRIEYSLGARTRCELEVRDYDSTQTAYRPALGERVEIIAPPTLFTGAIVNVRDTPLGAPGVGTVTKCQAMDDWRLAAKRLVTQTYSAGHTLNQLVYNIWALYLAEYGIKLEPMTVTGPTVNEPLTFEQVTIEETFNRLALLTGWVYRLHPSNVLQWFAIGTKIAGGFSQANENIRGPIEWTQTLGTYVNRVVLRYGSGTPERTDSFVGDKVTRAFKLTYPLATAGWIEYPAVAVDQQAFHQLGEHAPDGPQCRRRGVGVAMPGGLEYYPSDFPALVNFQNGPWPNLAFVTPPGSRYWPAGWGPSQLPGAASSWYWDYENHAMVHNQAFPFDPYAPTKGNITPPTVLVGFSWYLALKKEAVGVGFKWHYDATTNSIVSDYPFPPPWGIAFTFTYHAQYPLILVVEDAADIAANGVSEALFEAPDIFEYAEAKAYADSLLRKGGQTPRTVTFTTTNVNQGFLPGDSVYLDVPERTLPNDLWLVTEVQVEMDAAQAFSTQLTLLEGAQVQGSWIDFWRNTLGGATSTWGTGSMPGAAGAAGATVREGGEGDPVGELPEPATTTTPAVVTMIPPHTPGRLVKWGEATNTITDVLDTDLGVIGGITELTGDVRAGPGKGPQVATLRSSAGLSILGQPGFTAGPPIDITAPAGSNFVLREQDGLLGFGPAPGGAGGAAGPHAATHEPGGADALANLNASTLTSGTVPDARLSTNVALETVANVFTQPQQITSGLDVAAVLRLQTGNGAALGRVFSRTQDVVLSNNLSWSIGTGWVRDKADTPSSMLFLASSAALQFYYAAPGPAGGTATLQPRFTVDGATGNVEISAGSTYVLGPLSTVGPFTVNTTASVGGQLDCAGFIAKNIHNRDGSFVYPGRQDAPASQNIQGSWYLGSHASYGLYSNTGLSLGYHLWCSAVLSRDWIYEASRGTPMGHWIDIPFSAGNFGYFSCGAQTTLCYTLVGKTLTLLFELNSVTVPAVTSEFHILLPAGLTARNQGRTLVQVVNVSTNAPEVAFFTAGGNVLRISRFAGNFQAGSGNTAILGHAIIPVN